MTGSEFSLPAPRIELSKECTRFLQSKEDEPGMREFTDILCGKLTSIATTSLGKLTESHSKRRENLWKSFYQFRCIELPTIWKELLDKLQVPQKFHSDPWLPQFIARLVMEAIVKATCPVESVNCEHEPKPLDADEHNALRYTTGYVLRAVKKKSKNAAAIAWIDQQRLSTDADASSDDYLKFTREWVEKVNRGGLFVISDSMYMVFHSMEYVLRQYLVQLSSSHKIDKEAVIQYIYEDNDVRFYWCIVAVELDEGVAQELLKSIVHLWVSIRGFSYAGALVEKYKACCGNLKKQKALRKDLKRKSSDRTE